MKIAALVVAFLCAWLGLLSIYNGDHFGWLAMLVAAAFTRLAFERNSH